MAGVVETLFVFDFVAAVIVEGLRSGGESSRFAGGVTSRSSIILAPEPQPVIVPLQKMNVGCVIC
jgi:hypothetical protein